MLGLMLVAVGSSLAQEPAEVPLYFAVGIPAGNQPTIDADNADWAWVDRSFEITIDDMNPLIGGADDADDLFIDMIIGWQPSNNTISAMVHVHDDELIVDKNPGCLFRDDAVEVHFDPDNGGGGPVSAPNEDDLQPAYQMCMTFSQEFSRLQVYEPAVGHFGLDNRDFWWTHSGDFVQTEEASEGEEYYYEFSAVLFDPLAVNSGPEASTEWILAPESTIGMSISVDDADSGLNVNGDDGAATNMFWQGQYSMAEQFMNTGGMPDVFLNPVDDSETAVEATSWGQLKVLVDEEL
jgi:hypothetical protein